MPKGIRRGAGLLGQPGGHYRVLPGPVKNVRNEEIVAAGVWGVLLDTPDAAGQLLNDQTIVLDTFTTEAQAECYVRQILEGTVDPVMSLLRKRNYC